MLYYREVNPTESLSPYIDSYVCVSGTEFLSKSVTPKTGVTLVFDFQCNILFKGNPFQIALIGLHDQEFPLMSVNSRHDSLMINFSPSGLNSLSRKSSEWLLNQIVDASIFFGEAINLLYERLKSVNSTHRIQIVEHYFLTLFQAPSSTDQIVFELAEKIQLEPYHFSFADLKKNSPLGFRQIQRKFKQLLGTNIQTYVRVARFEKAKGLLAGGQPLRLTDIGYEAGYYDQSHFSTEFKKLSGTSPKNHTGC